MKKDKPKDSLRVGNTQDRILDSALALYNERGTAAVSTNHVADAAGLSVGNLYYHFKNREEIVRALFHRNAEETRVAFKPTDGADFGIGMLKQMVSANYEILWRYRFFYRELIVLLHRDPVLAEQFRAHRQYGFTSFEALLGAFGQSGVLKPMSSPEETNRLAVTVWLVSEFYIPYLESDSDVIRADFVAEGAALLQQVLQPFIAEDINRG